jgi:hypothetical protein
MKRMKKKTVLPTNNSNKTNKQKLHGDVTGPKVDGLARVKVFTLKTGRGAYENHERERKKRLDGHRAKLGREMTINVRVFFRAFSCFS